MSFRGTKPATTYAQPSQAYPPPTAAPAPRYVTGATGPPVADSRSRTIMSNGMEWHCNDCDDWEKYAQALEAEKITLKQQLTAAEMKYSDFELERSMNQAEMEMNAKAVTNNNAKLQAKIVKDLGNRAASLAVLALASLEAPMHIPTCEELSKRHVIGDEKKIAAAVAATAAASAAAAAAAAAAGGSAATEETPGSGPKRGDTEDGAPVSDATPPKKNHKHGHRKRAVAEESGEESAGSGSASYSENSSGESSSDEDASETAEEDKSLQLQALEVLALDQIIQALEPWVANESLHDVVLFPAGWVKATTPDAKAKGAKAPVKPPGANPVGVPAHACIIACRSRPLAELWFGDTTAEGGSKAPRNGSGVMCVQTAYSRPTLLALMSYLYTDRVHDDGLREEDGLISVTTLLQLYHAAVNYKLPLLRQIIQARVEESFAPKNALRFLSGANELDLKDVQVFALWFVTKERDVPDMQDAINSCDDVVVLRQTSKNQEENSFGPGKFAPAESTLREDLERLMGAAADPSARDTMFSDLRLISVQNIVGSHKVILAARCKVFEQELTNSKIDSIKGVNDPQGPPWGLTGEFVDFLLRYLYTNTVRIGPQANLLLFYSLTKMLGLEILTHWVTVCIQAQVDRFTVLKILKFAHSHLPAVTAIRLKQHCLALLERDCSIMVQYEEELRKLRDTPDLLRELITLTQNMSAYDGQIPEEPSAKEVEEVIVVAKPAKHHHKKAKSPAAKEKTPEPAKKVKPREKERPKVRFADEV